MKGLFLKDYYLNFKMDPVKQTREKSTLSR